MEPVGLSSFGKLLGDRPFPSKQADHKPDLEGNIAFIKKKPVSPNPNSYRQTSPRRQDRIINHDGQEDSFSPSPIRLHQGD